MFSNFVVAVFRKFQIKSPRGFLPRPLLRADKMQIQISLGFAKSFPPENSFGKTESALFRHLPEYLEGRTPKKNVLSFLEEIGRAQIRKARNIFSFWGCRVKRGGGGAFVERMI